MVHKPIAIIILPIFVAGIMMLGMLAATGKAQESSNTGNTATAILENTAAANTILKVHNDERAAVKSPALKWSNSLAADAKSWAENLASRPPKPSSSSGWNQCCGGEPDLVHGSTGENIWAGGANYYSTADMVQSWASEKNGYNFAPFDFNRDYAHAHYTQMVWKTTTNIGCATAIGNQGRFDFLVCRYSPPGNYNGENPY